MISHLDRYNFVHDKPTDRVQASSGNPSIYSAIYQVVTKLLGSPVVYNYDEPYYEYIEQSVRQNYTLWIRHPDKPSITSLDEMIGWIYFGYITSELMEEQNWRWYDVYHSPGHWKVFKALVYCAGEHRNFFKDQNVRDIHPVAYWIPWHIQYYLLKKEGKSVGILRTVMFYGWLISVLVKRNYKYIPTGRKFTIREYFNKKSPYWENDFQRGAVSQKNIALVILFDLGSKFWLRTINWKKNLIGYFGSHLITEKL